RDPARALRRAPARAPPRPRRRAARHGMRLPGLPRARPEAVGLDGHGLRAHSKANQRQVRRGLQRGVAECVLKDNRLVFTDVRGKQDVEHGTPMTDRSLIRCYSITKPITAFALLALWEEGKLGLGDPVAKYIPEFAQMRVASKRHKPARARRPITLRHLVTHTSG
ncbi:unnamed protein product, partial [Prorocentrum cordatum]